MNGISVTMYYSCGYNEIMQCIIRCITRHYSCIKNTLYLRALCKVLLIFPKNKRGYSVCSLYEGHSVSLKCVYVYVEATGIKGKCISAGTCLWDAPFQRHLQRHVMHLCK